jgi:hypothetical protein
MPKEILVPPVVPLLLRGAQDRTGVKAAYPGINEGVTYRIARVPSKFRKLEMTQKSERGNTDLLAGHVKKNYSIIRRTQRLTEGPAHVFAIYRARHHILPADSLIEQIAGVHPIEVRRKVRDIVPRVPAEVGGPGVPRSDHGTLEVLRLPA